MILVIDHHDSFVFNLARYFEVHGYQTHVISQDKACLSLVHKLNPSHLVLSPGPCAPEQAGCSLQMVDALKGSLPILGVCLGHQIIGQVMGAEIKGAKRPLHGQPSWIEHQGCGLFKGISSPCQVGRYHSLIVDETNLSPSMHVLARSEEGEIMAFVNHQYRLLGLQFHPESVLTPEGQLMINNFLTGACFDNQLGAADVEEAKELGVKGSAGSVQN